MKTTNMINKLCQINYLLNNYVMIVTLEQGF